MGAALWIRRLPVFSVGAATVIGAGQLLRGRPLAQAASHALAWGLVSAGVFIAVRLYHVHRGRRCALCRDMPEPGDR